MTTKPLVIVLTGKTRLSAVTIAALAAKAVAVERMCERVLTEASPEPLRLSILRDPEPIGPRWEPHTGKKKAQWKQETYGRKLK
jgi:hypothetical protein